MAGINNFLNIPASANKINRNEDLKKTANNKNEQKADNTANVSERKDQAQISNAARSMLSLRIDAQKYVDEIEQSKTLSDNDVKDLKQKINNKYFVDADVIDKIVDKLIDLPNFLIKVPKP